MTPRGGPSRICSPCPAAELSVSLHRSPGAPSGPRGIRPDRAGRPRRGAGSAPAECPAGGRSRQRAFRGCGISAAGAARMTLVTRSGGPAMADRAFRRHSTVGDHVGNQSISQIPVHLEAEEHVREAVIDQRPGLSRRNVLKFGSAALAVGVSGATVDVLKPYRAAAQTPKRGGIFRICSLLDPVGFDPHQTIAFTTMTMLSLTHSRLLKVKAGPSVRPGTYPIETDVAESWTRPNDTTYVFKLRRGVRWHPKPPVDGRELTADDVKYTYERFLNIKGNGNRATLESVDKIEALDRYTVKFTLKEPFAWFLDALASTSTWLVAKEAVEKFGDLKRAEAVIGTGPWMLERYEPNVKLTFVRNPNYFVPGLPYADGIEVTVDADPSSRVAAWLAGT